MAFGQEALVKKLLNMAIFAGISVLLLSLFPTPEMPEGMKTALQYFFDLLFEWDFIIPARTIMNAITITVGLELAIAILYGFIFAYRLSGIKK